MIFSKKIISLATALCAACAFFVSVSSAYAATPILSVSPTGSGDTVNVNITNANPNASIILYYISTNAGLSVEPIGSTDAYGNASEVVSTSQYNIAANASTYVMVGGLQSSAVAWPNISSASASNALTFSQTSLVMTAGQSSTVTVNNNTNNATLYVSNNSNPPVANVSLPNNQQVTITALSVGSAVVSICPLNNAAGCASMYVTVVQNSSVQALSFNQNNVTVANGQTVPVSISGGTGVYTVLNNSNASAINATLSGSNINLYAEGVSGSASVTVCSTDMSSCGIITATIGTVSSTGIVFNQTYPTLGTGQTLPISVSGGSGTYSISSNSNPSDISASISGNTLNLYGQANGTATITVCSSGGSCGTLTPTVNYVASGGALTLSQTSLTLLLGQTLSVTVSGGQAPYSLLTTSNSQIFQSSLANNIITVTGFSAGSSVLSVCSASGGCTGLSITVNGAASGNNTLQPAMSENNLSMTAGESMSITLSGSGGYYVSNNTNTSVASAYISGSNIIVTANALGDATVTVCQSGGECNTLSINVVSTASGSIGATANPIFNPSTVSVAVGQNTTVGVSGGASANYYLASNSNSSAASVSFSGSTLSVSGTSAGSSIAIICASANSCSPLFITVNPQTAVQVITFTPINPSVGVGQATYVTLSGAASYYISSSANNNFTASINGDLLSLVGMTAGQSSVTVCSTSGSCQPVFVTVTSAAALNTSSVSTNAYQFLSAIKYGERGTDVTELQEKLKALGVYSGPVTGYFGDLTLAAVKKYQQENGLSQVGSVGPQTRALLNRS